MTAVDRAIPFDMPMTTAKANLTQEGLVLKKGSGNTLELADGKGDQVVAILDQMFCYADQTQKTTVSTTKRGVFFVGSGDKVYVASQTTLTWALGDTCFISDATDGMCRNATESSSRPIGHYMGTGTTTTADGDLVEIVLDVAQGATLE